MATLRRTAGRDQSGSTVRLRSRAELAHFIVLAYRHAVARTRRNGVYWGICAGTLGLEVALIFVLRAGEIYGWEVELTRFVQRAPARDEIFEVVNFFTNTINWRFALVFLAVVAVVLTLRHYAAAMLLALTFPLHVLTQFPKVLVDRPRPPALFEGIEGVGGLRSYPSGHAEFVVTFYGFLAVLLLVHAHRRRSRVLIVAGWTALALATGFARVAVGRHWPLDIAASYVIGAGALAGLVWLYEALRSARATFAAERTSRGGGRVPYT